MTVYEFAKLNDYRIVTNEEIAKTQQITGVYTCDLLSWAMAKVQDGNMWITVHTNLNVVAVASLTSAACVMIPESIEIEQSTIDRANSQDVSMLSSQDGAAVIVVNAYLQMNKDVISK